MTIKLKKLTETAQVPTYSTENSAGLDLRADIKEAMTLYPGERVLIPTGLSMEIPSGKVGLVCSRSGLAIKHGIAVLNAPGIIDADFRGEIKVILINLGTQNKDLFVIRPNDRIAQLAITDYNYVNFSVTTELTETQRGEGGFGSSGVS